MAWIFHFAVRQGIFEATWTAVAVVSKVVDPYYQTDMGTKESRAHEDRD